WHELISCLSLHLSREHLSKEISTAHPLCDACAYYILCRPLPIIHEACNEMREDLTTVIAPLSTFLTKFLHFAYVVLTQRDVCYGQKKKTPVPDSTASTSVNGVAGTVDKMSHKRRNFHG